MTDVRRDGVTFDVARSIDRLACAGLLATIVCAPIVFASGTDAAWTGFRLAMAGVLVTTSLSWAAGTTMRRLPTALLLPWIVLVVMTWVSVVSSRYVTPSITEALTIMSYLSGLPLSFHHARSRRRRLVLVGAAVVTSVATMTYGALQYVGDAALMAGAQRSSSTYANPNEYAGFLDLIVPACLVLAVVHPRLVTRVLAAVLFVLGSANLLLTLSRGAWVAVTVAIVSAGLVSRFASSASAQRDASPLPSKRRTANALLLAAVVVALWAGATTLTPGLTRAFEARVQQLVYVATNPEAFDRMYIAAAAWRVVIESPWTGVGPGNFVDAVTPFRPLPDPALGLHTFHTRIVYAHNDVLQIASESGVVAAAAFVALWAAILLRGVRRDDAFALAARAGLVAIFIHGIVDGNLTIVPVNAFLAYVAAGALHARR